MGNQFSWPTPEGDSVRVFIIDPDGARKLLVFDPAVTVTAKAETSWPEDADALHRPPHSEITQLSIGCDLTEVPPGRPKYTLYHVGKSYPGIGGSPADQGIQPTAQGCHFCAQVLPMLCDDHRPQVAPVPPDGYEWLLMLGGPLHGRIAEVEAGAPAGRFPRPYAWPSFTTFDMDDDTPPEFDVIAYHRSKLGRNGMRRDVLLYAGIRNQDAPPLLADHLAAQWFGSGEAVTEDAAPNVIMEPDQLAGEVYKQIGDGTLSYHTVADTVRAIRIMRAEGVQLRPGNPDHLRRIAELCGYHSGAARIEIARTVLTATLTVLGG